MELTDLVALFRLHTQDIELPGDGDDSESLFSTEEIIEYFDFAHKEFVRRTEIIKDSRNTAYTSFTVTADDPWIDIPAKIISIKKGSLTTAGTRLKVVNHRELDQGFMIDDYGLDWEGNWETKTGTPTLIITDMETASIRLFPIPISDDTLTLHVTRYPKEDLESLSDEPEIPEQFHRKLLHHALHTAYSKQDADAFDPDKADFEYSKFEEAVEAAMQEIGKRYRRTSTTKYGGI